MLSTQELLENYQKCENEITELTQKLREDWVKVNCSVKPEVRLRDQLFITVNTVRMALQNKVEPREWYKLLNSMVFFWPRKEQLEKMLGAYNEIDHDVLIVCTKKLVKLEESNIRLSRINSGRPI